MMSGRCVLACRAAGALRSRPGLPGAEGAPAQGHRRLCPPRRAAGASPDLLRTCLHALITSLRSQHPTTSGHCKQSPQYLHARLQGYEIPRELLVEFQPFTKENHMLTDAGKPARGQLRDRWPLSRCHPASAYSPTLNSFHAEGCSCCSSSMHHSLLPAHAAARASPVRAAADAKRSVNEERRMIMCLPSAQPTREAGRWC